MLPIFGLTVYLLGIWKIDFSLKGPKGLCNSEALSVEAAQIKPLGYALSDVNRPSSSDLLKDLQITSGPPFSRQITQTGFCYRAFPPRLEKMYLIMISSVTVPTTLPNLLYLATQKRDSRDLFLLPRKFGFFSILNGLCFRTCYSKSMSVRI